MLLIKANLFLHPILSLIVSLLLQRISSKEPTQEKNEIWFSHSYGNTPLVKSCFGVPFQCFKLKLSSTYNQNWLIGGVNNNKYYDKLFSKSYTSKERTVPIPERGNGVFGVESIDSVMIGLFTLNKMEFALIEQMDVFEYTGVLSFGFLHEENDFSFLSALHQTKQIQRMMFYLTYFNHEKGRLVFGVYPKESKEKKYRRCSLYQTKADGRKNNRWECELNAIYYEGSNSIHFFKTNSRISFNISANVLLFPRAVFDVFTTNYFGPYFGEGRSCQESKTTSSTFTQILCERTFDYHQLGNLNYIIGKWTLTLKPKDLFVLNQSDNLKFVVSKHEKIDKFIFGNPMFFKYSTVFDKEKKEIGLYINQDIL